MKSAFLNKHKNYSESRCSTYIIYRSFSSSRKQTTVCSFSRTGIIVCYYSWSQSKSKNYYISKFS